MGATKSPTALTKPLVPTATTINPADVVQRAILQKDVSEAKSLLEMRTRRQFIFRDWASLMDAGVNSLDEDNRDIFRSVLIDLARDKLLAFLRTALQSYEEEQVAMLILERREDLFLKKLDGDSPFHLAASNGQAQVVDRFLEFVKKSDRRDLVTPFTNGKGDVVENGQPASQSMTGLEKAAEKGHLEVVEMLVDFDERLLDYGYPLHKAVREGRFEVVEYLLKKKSDLVEKFTPEPSPKSALFEERTLGKEDESSIAIDKLLVASIIRGPPGENRSRSPAMIKKLLQGPQDQHTEICLDLSIFSQTTHKFLPFVDGLLSGQQLFDIRFHPTLLYVEFPTPSASYHLNGPITVGREAERILQWLRKKKKVSEIIRLRVPGTTPRAETEEVIESALEGISVDVLDWRVLDLSIDIILKGRTRDVQELHLYSSGNWGVLQQWSGVEGVTQLRKLNQLRITIIEGMISIDREQEYLIRLEERLKDAQLANLHGRDPPAPKVEFSVDTSPWQETFLSSRMGHHSLQETTLTITKLKKFLDFYGNCDKRGHRPTKVAIIDNGIDTTLSSLSRRIIDGHSYVEDFEGRESPWWLASHPHGTQMASFIHQLDPFCGLYIAKVCDEASGVDPDLVAQAIDWAREKKVDVISISIAMPTPSKPLEKAIESAKSNNIVMIGSRGDRGGNRDLVYPADYDEVISISSYTNLGDKTGSTETSAQYFFQGENVSIPAEPSYLESQKRASGSSVATALAAGIAALTLSCRRLGDNETKVDRIKTVKSVFDRMTLPDQDKYVRPWKVFKDENMDAEEGWQWLKSNFGTKGDFCL